MRLKHCLWTMFLMAIGTLSSCQTQIDRSTDKKFKTTQDKSLFKESKNIEVPEGFKVELIYSVPLEEQGSWVALTPDNTGRLITSDQFGSLYRVTVGKNPSETSSEKLDIPIGHAQGLLYAHNSLYVTVNLHPNQKNSKVKHSGVYRVSDSTGDDQLDKLELLKTLEAVDNENGHGEHGPHGLQISPDGHIYLVAGNGTKIPDDLNPTSPHRNWADDLLIPSNNAFVPGGWVARTDLTGENWELVAGGIRNPYDLAFQPDGELFTVDADSEMDIGAPWYRPTRVNHIVSAGEYGWRYDTGPWRFYGKWPDHYPDSVGSVVDIGPGSPTGIAFGTGTRFPLKYQRALFVCDWSSGKIYAIHFRPYGASYKATFETFLTGSAMPLTDLVVNQDGALYFTTGGRESKSGLFRIVYTGTETIDPVGPIENSEAFQARNLRRYLEQFHGQKNPRAVEEAWPHLVSQDRSIRYAARIAIEHQNIELWQHRALKEDNIIASTQAMISLARVGGKELQQQVIEKLNQLPLETLPEGQLLEVLRAYGLALIRMESPMHSVVKRNVSQRLEILYPSSNQKLNQELCRLLVYVKNPEVISKSLKLLQKSPEQNKMFYFATLSLVKEGWSLEQLQLFFTSLNLAEKEHLRTQKKIGNRKMNSRFMHSLETFRSNVTETLSHNQREELAVFIEGQQNVISGELESNRKFVQNWKLSDLVPFLHQLQSGRSYDNGKTAYRDAGCTNCHRFGDQGGTTGPDITSVGKRFDAHYLLESLLVPSKVIPEQFLTEVIKMENGVIYTGRVVYNDGKMLRLREDPFSNQNTKLDINEIEKRTLLKTSEMPEGLLNVLTKDQVLDLIAYLSTGGNPESPIFMNP